MEDNSSKRKNLFKEYGYFIAVGVGVFVFALITIIASLNYTPADDTGGPVDAPPETFYQPVLNATLYKGYSGTRLQYNETLNKWEAHKALSLQVVAGSNVYAVLDGEVVDVYGNYMEGNVVVIKHSNNMKSYYGSLAEGVALKVGDKVTKGDVVGKASDSGKREAKAGSYLKFMLMDNDGKKIDPSGYLNMEVK